MYINGVFGKSKNSFSSSERMRIRQKTHLIQEALDLELYIASLTRLLEQQELDECKLLPRIKKLSAFDQSVLECYALMLSGEKIQEGYFEPDVLGAILDIEG